MERTVVAVRTWKVQRSARVEIDDGRLTFVLPGWFSRPVVVPLGAAFLLDASTSSVDDDLVFARPVKFIEIPQRGSFTRANTVFLFRQPVSVRPRPFAYQSTDLSWRQGRRGEELIDGLILELRDAPADQASLRRAGLGSITFAGFASEVVGIEPDPVVAASLRGLGRSVDRWWHRAEFGVFVGGAVAITGEMSGHDPIALLGAVIAVVSVVTQIGVNRWARRQSAVSRPPDAAS